MSKYLSDILGRFVRTDCQANNAVPGMAQAPIIKPQVARQQNWVTERVQQGNHLFPVFHSLAANILSDLLDPNAPAS